MSTYDAYFGVAAWRSDWGLLTGSSRLAWIHVCTFPWQGWALTRNDQHLGRTQACPQLRQTRVQQQMSLVTQEGVLLFDQHQSFYATKIWDPLPRTMSKLPSKALRKPWKTDGLNSKHRFSRWIETRLITTHLLRLCHNRRPQHVQPMAGFSRVYLSQLRKMSWCIASNHEKSRSTARRIKEVVSIPVMQVRVAGMGGWI